jgi:hypothetical protein
MATKTTTTKTTKASAATKATKASAASKATKASAATKATKASAASAASKAAAVAEKVLADKERAKAGEGPKAVHAGVRAERSQLAAAVKKGDLAIKVAALLHKGALTSEPISKSDLKRLFVKNGLHSSEHSANAGVDRLSPPRGTFFSKNERGMYQVEPWVAPWFESEVAPWYMAD